jgi:hypothetical protein
MRARAVDAPPGPDPDPALLDVACLAEVPTVRVLTVESVELPDILRDQALLEPADVCVMSSEAAVRSVESEAAEDGLELGRATEGMPRVERPFVA